MKMRVIKFKDGTYGVVKGFLLKSYLSSDTMDQWWTTPYLVAKYCKFKTEEEATKAALKASVEHTVVKWV
jgi:hypothetical protein